MPSYYVTYGGNRLTYQGVSGPVAWYHEPGYHETLLWSGSQASGTITLSGDPSAYDMLRIVPGGQDQAKNSISYNPLEVTYKTLSSTNNVIFENPFYTETAASGISGMWFGGILTGCSGKEWTFTKGWGHRWNVTAHGSDRYDYSTLKQIWGVKYA